MNQKNLRTFITTEMKFIRHMQRIPYTAKVKNEYVMKKAGIKRSELTNKIRISQITKKKRPGSSKGKKKLLIELKKR